MAGVLSGWEIASTLATIGATIVALFVPFILDWRQGRTRRQELARARLDATLEIIRAVEEARDAYDAAALELKAEPLQTLRLRDVEERSLRAAKVIRHLMKRNDLTDGVVRCGVDGAALGIETAKAIRQAYPDTDISRAAAQDYWEFHVMRADRVDEQIARLRDHHKLPSEGA